MDGEDRRRSRFRRWNKRAPLIENSTVPVSRNRAQGLLAQGGSIREDLTALGVHHGDQRGIGNRSNKNAASLTHSDRNQQSKGDGVGDGQSTKQAISLRFQPLG